jgi:hypothetical protein
VDAYKKLAELAWRAGVTRNQIDQRAHQFYGFYKGFLQTVSHKDVKDEPVPARNQVVSSHGPGIRQIPLLRRRSLKMKLVLDLTNVQFSQELVPAAGVTEFIYPLGGSVLRGVQLEAYRSCGVGDTVDIPAMIPPVCANDVEWIAYLTATPLDPRARMAMMNWIQASIVDDGSQAYRQLHEYLTDRIRETGRELSE